MFNFELVSWRLTRLEGSFFNSLSINYYSLVIRRLVVVVVGVKKFVSRDWPTLKRLYLSKLYIIKTLITSEMCWDSFRETANQDGGTYVMYYFL